MHGRIKVRTTEEQAAAKKKEQEEKLKVYLKTTSSIFAKREAGDHDDEGLQLTGAVLERNPEFYTLWNYRREILLAMKPNKSAEEIKSLSNTELSLTQHCLQKNPKSYAAWHHRFWAMEFNPEADWKKELKLCGYFLSQDERNFHCWDYRRAVAKKCEVSPVEELNYTTELIESNFSNYSAWHYRSTLLPIVHPGATKGSITENILLKELDMVQNAAFTDPDDQSVWFYHRWLLGRSKIPLQVMNIVVLKPQGIVSVLLSEPEEVDGQCLKLDIDGTCVDITWKSVSSNIPVSSVWTCCVPDMITDDCNITVELCKAGRVSSLCCYVYGDKSYIWNQSTRAHAFRLELSAATKEVLEQELISCQQLNELEPNSKWTLFTCILLMRALNDAKFQEDTKEYMKLLKTVDAARKNYYNDLGSKFVIEDYIESFPLDASNVNLANKGLTSLHHFDQFTLIESVNLSSNSLTSTFSLCYLISAKTIILDNNQLTNLVGLEELKNLQILSVRNNLIAKISVLEDLKNCESLEKLLIEDNPVVEDPNIDYQSILKKFLALKVIDVVAR